MPAPEEVVRGLFAAFAARDADAAVALCDPEVRFWPEGTGGIAAREAPYQGLDGMRRYFADVAQHWRALTVTPGDLRVAGDAVVVFGRVEGTTATGGDLEVPVIYVFKLRAGRLLSGRVVATSAEAAAVAAADGPA